MTEPTKNRLRVAVIDRSAGLSCLQRLRQSPEFEIVPFQRGRDALRASLSPAVWIVARTLDDMDGLTCVEMLAQTHEESRFFVIAEEFDSEDERNCFQLPRTKYLCSQMAEHWLTRLLRSQSRTTSIIIR